MLLAGDALLHYKFCTELLRIAGLLLGAEKAGAKSQGCRNVPRYLGRSGPYHSTAARGTTRLAGKDQEAAQALL